MQIKRTSRNTILVLLIIALISFVAAFLLIFRQKTLGIISAASLENISENQAMYTQTLQSKFSDLLNMLEAQARYFEDVDLHDDDALKKTISRTKGIGDFKKIAIANKEGDCTNRDGKNFPNIYNKSYFHETLKTGKPQISNKIEVDENLEPILTLTYPIKRDKSVEAAIIGTLSYDVLKNLFAVSLFSGESYMYIISADGNVILCNREKNRNLYNVSIYDLVKNRVKTNSSETHSEHVISKMKSDILKNNSAFMPFDGKDSRKLFTYAPLGINNWYIISVIPYSYILQQQSKIGILVYILLGVIAFTISVFVLVFYSLFKKTSSIEKDNERLTIASQHAQALIFEYDLQKKQVAFSGDTQFVLGVDKKLFTVDFIRIEYYKRIHPDDKKVMLELRKAVAESAIEYTGEFRYKDFSGEYIWLKISGNLLKNEYGTGKKFIGTITNVNSQVLHEQELKSIAERDKLTGLLNKSAMEQNSCKLLATADKKLKCALFIIDLDNFKKVNDTLGHLVGDMAIVDAAKKISLIFSEKDFISRFGGDEFCILLRFSKNLTDEEIEKLISEKAQNLCTFLREDYFDENTVISVSASVGISFYPENGVTYEQLFEAADSALYKVKENGKNGFKIFKKDAENS